MVGSMAGARKWLCGCESVAGNWRRGEGLESTIGVPRLRVGSDVNCDRTLPIKVDCEIDRSTDSDDCSSGPAYRASASRRFGCAWAGSCDPAPRPSLIQYSFDRSKQDMSLHDVIILGAGAAGLMCAITAGQRGRRVLLFDHAVRTRRQNPHLRRRTVQLCSQHRTIAPERYLRKTPHFCPLGPGSIHTGPFHRTGAAPRHRLPRKSAKVSFSATAPPASLSRCCCGEARAGRRRSPPRAQGHRRDQRRKNSRSTRTTDRSSPVTSSWPRRIIDPKLGATSFAYDAARRFGLRVTETGPGLVPLTFGDELLALMRPLAGDLPGHGNHPRPPNLPRVNPVHPSTACPARRSCKFRPGGARDRSS